MILTEKVKVTITYNNIEHFKNKGYDIKCFDKIEIPIKDISPQSNIRVNVKCDYCGKEKEIKYQSYSKGTKFGTDKYACSSKCAWDKNRATNTIRYGVEAPMQNNEIKKKSRETVLEKYGVDNISKTEHFKEKYKNTMIDKYGVENGFQSEVIKDRMKKTMLNKYGVEYNTQRESIKEEFLYGENNYFYIHGQGSVDEWMSPYAKRIKGLVYKRDDKKCCICGESKRIDMNVHHIYSRNTHPELIYDMENMTVMCKGCHIEFHRIYGFGNNTREQFEEHKQLKSKDSTTIESVV